MVSFRALRFCDLLESDRRQMYLIHLDSHYGKLKIDAYMFDFKIFRCYDIPYVNTVVNDIVISLCLYILLSYSS